MTIKFLRTNLKIVVTSILFVFLLSLFSSFGSINTLAAPCSDNTKPYEACSIGKNEECTGGREKQFVRGTSNCRPLQTRAEYDQQRANAATQNANAAAVINTATFNDPDACAVKKKITMTDIVNPGEFFPVIPEGCGSIEGKAVPLSLAVAPDIAIRFFGALASLVFYLFTFVAIFSGIMWTYGGIDGQSNITAKRNFKDSFVGLILVTTVYAIINTIMVVLEVNLPSTDINSFFTFG